MDFFKAHIWWISISVCATVLFSGYFSLFSPPTNFPSGSIITIDKGASASHIAQELAGAHVVAHSFVLELVLRMGVGSTRVQAGAYLFQKPQNLFSIAYRLVKGDYGLPPVRITFVEGTTLKEIAKQVSNEFATISAEKFISLGQSQEGYLFPDTYLFQPSVDSESIIKKMRENFDVKIIPLKNDIVASGHSFSDIVIMASVIEKEARDDVDRHMISGILWNRIELGMPLQVDAADETYLHIGFPPKPICNPGLESIEAALHPTKTDYMYYLTGKDGLMHYAKTFAAHQSNQRKYMK